MGKLAAAETISQETGREDQLSYLSFHLPARDGGLAVVTRLKLQSHRSGADVGDGQVSWRARQLCGRGDEESESKVTFNIIATEKKIFEPWRVERTNFRNVSGAV